MKKTLKSSLLLNFIKIIGTLIFSYLVIRQIEVRKLLEILEDVYLLSYLLALFIFIFGIFLSTVRWKLLLKAVDVSVVFCKLFRLYVLGLLLNLIFPSTIGGDSIKVYKIVKEKGKKILLVTSIATFLGRLLGLIAIIIILLIVLLLQIKFQLILFIACLILASLIVFWIYKRMFIRFTFDKNIVTRFPSMGVFIDKIIKFISMYRSKKSTIVMALFISVIFQIIGVFNQYIIMKSIGINLPLKLLFVVVPIVRLVTVIPISIGGAGIKEVTLIYLLEPYGVSTSQIIAYSIVRYSMFMILAIIYFLNNLVKSRFSVSGSVLKDRFF